jgi:type II secretory pathway component PulF
VRETGRLGEVLERLADYLEARQALKQKFTLALIYPALVTIIALGVIVVLLTYVVPQVVSVYEQSRQTLPWLTQALIASVRFLPRHVVGVAHRARRRARRVLARQSQRGVSRALARGAAARLPGSAGC